MSPRRGGAAVPSLADWSGSLAFYPNTRWSPAGRLCSPVAGLNSVGWRGLAGSPLLRLARCLRRLLAVLLETVVTQASRAFSVSGGPGAVYTPISICCWSVSAVIGVVAVRAVRSSPTGQPAVRAAGLRSVSTVIAAGVAASDS